MSIPPGELLRLLESLSLADEFRRRYPDGVEIQWDHEDLGDRHVWTISMLPIGDPVEVCHGRFHRRNADLSAQYTFFCTLAEGHPGRCRLAR